MSAGFLAIAREGAWIIDYIHLNRVRRGLLKRPEDRKRSSMPEFAGVSGEEQERRCGLRIDRVQLPGVRGEGCEKSEPSRSPRSAMLP
jgi:hypothetical protein